MLKVRDIIFDEYHHIKRVTINATDDDNLPNLWNDNIPISTSHNMTDVSTSQVSDTLTHQQPHAPEATGPAEGTENKKLQTDTMTEDSKGDSKVTATDNDTMDRVYAPSIAPQDFEHGPWLDPADETYGRGRRCQAAAAELIALVNGETNLEEVKTVLVTLAEDEPENYKEAMTSPDAEKWKSACAEEYNMLMGYYIWTLVERPPNTNIVESHWMFHVKHGNHGQVNRYKAWLIAQGFSQVPGLDFNETYALTT